MRRLPSLTSVALLGILMAGCADQPVPTDVGFGPERPPISFAKKIRGGGFDLGENDGSVSSTSWPPTGWSFFAAGMAQDPGDAACGVRGRCAVGDVVESFAGLGIPSSPNPNPNDGDDARFAVVSTTNFSSESGGLVVTNQSAIRSLRGSFILPAGGLQLLVDLAFLTGEMGAGAHNDFASITIRPRIPGAKRVQVIRLEADDPLHWKVNGCGSSTFGGDNVTSNYPLCTDWTPYSVDVSRFGGQEVEVEIRVREGGGSNGVATTLAIDNLRFNRLPAAGPISLSPSPAQAERPVEVRAGFTDGDSTDTHRAVWNWGDGTSTTRGIIDPVLGSGAAGLVRNSHTYSRPGSYTMSLTVTDIDGGVGRTRRRITVVN